MRDINVSASGATYEVYVSGVNSAGVGEPSTRIVFRTASKQIEDLIETSQHPYNQTECCLNSGISEDCKKQNIIQQQESEDCVIFRSATL